MSGYEQHRRSVCVSLWNRSFLLHLFHPWFRFLFPPAFSFSASSLHPSILPSFHHTPFLHHHNEINLMDSNPQLLRRTHSPFVAAAAAAASSTLAVETPGHGHHHGHGHGHTSPGHSHTHTSPGHHHQHQHQHQQPHLSPLSGAHGLKPSGMSSPSILGLSDSSKALSVSIKRVPLKLSFSDPLLVTNGAPSNDAKRFYLILAFSYSVHRMDWAHPLHLPHPS